MEAWNSRRILFVNKNSHLDNISSVSSLRHKNWFSWFRGMFSFFILFRSSSLFCHDYFKNEFQVSPKRRRVQRPLQIAFSFFLGFHNSYHRASNAVLCSLFDWCETLEILLLCPRVCLGKGHGCCRRHSLFVI